MIKLVFKHPDYPPALNGKNGLLRMHWTKRDELLKKFMWIIKAQRFKPIPGQVSLTMINYYIHPMDWDNLCSRLKIIGDAMVKCKLIQEDNPDVIVDFLPKQERVNARRDVRIEFIFERYVK